MAAKAAKAAKGEYPPPRLLNALQDISAWRESAESLASAQLNEVTAEEAHLSEQIARLKEQLQAAQARQAEVRATLDGLDDEEVHRSYDAVVESLQDDHALLALRSEEYDKAVDASVARAEAMLENDELRNALQEYEGFGDAEAALSSLPPSYRQAIQAHHEAVRARLQPLFKELAGETISLKMDGAQVAVICSLDPAEGTPEALVMVLPVEAGLYDDWDDRRQDLGACVAYRLVGAAAELAARAGVANAHLSYRPFAGHLAIRIWFGSQRPDGDLQEITQALLQRIGENALELRRTSIRLTPLWLPPAVLREQERPSHDAPPPEAAEDANDDDTEDEEPPLATLVDEEDDDEGTAQDTPGTTPEDGPIPDFYVTETEA